MESYLEIKFGFSMQSNHIYIHTIPTSHSHYKWYQSTACGFDRVSGRELLQKQDLPVFKETESHIVEFDSVLDQQSSL